MIGTYQAPVPVGHDGLCKALGHPSQYTGPDGVMSPAELAHWEERLGLVYVSLPSPVPLAWDPAMVARVIRCPGIYADRYRDAFAILQNGGLWQRKIHDFGGCFFVRMKRGNPRQYSAHAWGLAIDLNVARNPRGAIPHQHPDVVTAFEASGFEWGGHFSVPDGMHFQLCRNY